LRATCLSAQDRQFMLQDDDLERREPVRVNPQNDQLSRVFYRLTLVGGPHG
jgi:hypothetical protein